MFLAVTFHTDPAAADISDQKVLVCGTVGVVATGATEGIPGPPRITLALDRVILDWMSLGQPSQRDVTVNAKVVNLPKELKTIVGGMRTVASTAALGVHDAVDHEALLAGIKILLHFLMTDHTELTLAIGPQLKLIAASVRVVANGTIAGTDRSMDMGHGGPFPVVDMTVKAQRFDFAGGYRQLLGIRGGLMAGSA